MSHCFQQFPDDLMTFHYYEVRFVKGKPLRVRATNRQGAHQVAKNVHPERTVKTVTFIESEAR